MSKLGRYSADRKKVATLAAGASTIAAAKCGTIFLVDCDTAATPTLPAVADAGAGWWCKFVNVDEGTEDIVITAPGAIMSVSTHSSQGGDVKALSAGGLTTITLNAANASTLGDQVEIFCDGTLYHALVHIDEDAAVTVA